LSCHGCCCCCCCCVMSWLWSSRCHLLQSITGIKDFLSHVKNRLSSIVHMHDIKLPIVRTCSNTTLNCRKQTSGCMMLNCPPSVHDDKLQTDGTTHGTCSSTRNGASPDDAMYGAIGSMNGTSTQTTPELIRSPSTDSFQTHDSLATPESPRTHLPSPWESLEEGTEDAVTQVRTNDTETQVRTDDSLAYDSLVTALSRLSLEPPHPGSLSDHQ